MPHVVFGSAPDFVCSEITPMWNEEKQKICQHLASAFLRLWLYHLRCHVIFHMKRESRYRYSLARRLVLDEAFLPICYFEEYKDGILSNPVPKKSSYNFKMTRNLSDKTQNVSVNPSSRLVVTVYIQASHLQQSHGFLFSTPIVTSHLRTLSSGFSGASRLTRQLHLTYGFCRCISVIIYSLQTGFHDTIRKKRRLVSGTVTRVTHASIVTRWSLIWSFSSECHGTRTDGFSGIFNGGFINKHSWEVVQFKTSLYWKWAMFLCPAAHFWCCSCTDKKKIVN